MFDHLGFPVALQFKPDGRGGYLYRKDQFGPAVAATAAERDHHVSRMGWMMVLGTILYMGGVIVMAVIASAFLDSNDDAVGVGGAIVMAGIAFTGLYLFIRWASHAPARAFVGRAQVAPALSRKQVLGPRMARMTYTRLFVVCAGLAAMLAVGSIQEPQAIWLAIGLPATIGIGFAIWKWRVENE